MIKALASFAVSKLRIFGLLAIILLGAGSFRAVNELVPDFSKNADEFAFRASQLLSTALGYGESPDVDGAENASTPDGLANRLVNLFAFRGENPTSDDALLTGSTAVYIYLVNHK